MDDILKVIVTGAGTGIGRGIALYFAGKGARVAVHCSRSMAGAEAVVREIISGKGEAKVFQADFSLIENVRKLASNAVSWLGGVDVLINNAGITFNEPFSEVTEEQFDTLYTVNVKAPYFLIQSLIPELKRSGGRIINLTSIHGIRGMHEHSTYAGTKGAIISYTRSLAIELAPMGIRLNAIAPGAVEVENQHAVCKNYDPIGAGRLIPSGFIGQPEDVAGLAWFLGSKESRYIIGQTVVIDGGTSNMFAFTDEFRKPLTDKFGLGYVPGKELDATSDFGGE